MVSESESERGPGGLLFLYISVRAELFNYSFRANNNLGSVGVVLQRSPVLVLLPSRGLGVSDSSPGSPFVTTGGRPAVIWGRRAPLGPCMCVLELTISVISQARRAGPVSPSADWARKLARGRVAGRGAG